MTRIHKIERETLDAARREALQVRNSLKSGEAVLRETVLSDGMPGTIRGVGDSIDTARRNAQQRLQCLPAVVTGESIVRRPEGTGESITVKARSEEKARKRIQYLLGYTIPPEALELVERGGRVAFVLWRRPNEYRVLLPSSALVELSYKTKAVIAMEIGPPQLTEQTTRKQLTSSSQKTALHPLALTCEKCGQLYNLGQDSFAMTTSGALDGFSVFTVMPDGTQSDNLEDPDLVDSCDWSGLNKADFYRNEIAKICSSIDSGRSRWWQCRKCSQAQQYQQDKATSAGSTTTATTGTENPSLSSDIVCDRNAGLMWQAKHDDKKMNQEEAFAYCRSLTLANHSDWTLPTLAQFRNLWQNKTLCSQLSVADNDFWTASNFEERPATQAYASDGNSFYKTCRFYVRAVRRV